MKIELNYPFTDHYKAGYLLCNDEPRRFVSLVGFKGERKSISYARYLMSCHLKRFLTSEEEVDHRDDDKMNDVIDNFQILTRKENLDKKLRSNNVTRKMVIIRCPNCSKIFARRRGNTHLVPSRGVYTSCSKICSNKIKSDLCYSDAESLIERIMASVIKIVEVKSKG